MTEINSRIFYRGPSQLDGAPILGIITGLSTPSTNTKTGDMLQTYILREDVSPPDAIVHGHDRSICGACALRGDGHGLGRSCYVQVKWAPLAVWKFVQDQIPGWYTSGQHEAEIYHGKQDRFLRLGTYGDPCAIPLYVWEWLLTRTAGHTGYTHQWREDRFHDFRHLCMASVESVADQQQAGELGWRTFRTRGSIAEGLMTHEITCPASAEAGHKTTCQACRLCDGTGASMSRKNIAIVAHGSRAAKYGTQVLPFEEDWP